MTLLATEIHRQADMDVIVFVADQRIVRGSSPWQNQQKIFPIKQIRAGIQPSSQHPFLWCGMNSTLFRKHQLDQPPEPHRA
jgi:hypothetical protein